MHTKIYSGTQADTLASRQMTAVPDSIIWIAVFVDPSTSVNAKSFKALVRVDLKAKKARGLYPPPKL